MASTNPFLTESRECSNPFLKVTAVLLVAILTVSLAHLVQIAPQPRAMEDLSGVDRLSRIASSLTATDEVLREEVAPDVS